MNPTPAHAAADEAVADALMERARILDPESTGVITGWFAITAITDYIDGQQVTRYVLGTPYEQPVHIDLGFLTYATERVRSWTWPIHDDNDDE